MKQGEEIQETKETSQKSPFAGCAILLTALLVMAFLVIFSVYVLFRQFDEIAKFTDVEAEKVGVESLEDREVELNDLAEKLELFRLAVRDDEASVLELSVGEMNLAIAAYEQLKDLRGTLRVREIKEGEVYMEISFRMNGKPRLAKGEEVGVIGSDPRFLNGVMVAELGLLDGEVVLQVKDIEVEGVDVAKEFIEQMSPYRIAEKYKGDDGIGMVMTKLTGVETKDGMVRFEKKEGVEPKDTVSSGEVDQAGRRLFMFMGVAASLFLLFAGVVIFIGLRLKKRNEQPELEK